MWTDLNRVAEEMLLNKKAFKAFALEDPIKYGLIDEQVSTWNVDRLISDYKKSIGEERYTMDRQASIDALKK